MGVRQFVLERRLQQMICEWENEVEENSGSLVSGKVKGEQKNLLIIPSDPYLLTASTGDQAMISAIRSYWKERLPEAQFYVATAGEEGDAAAKAADLIPLQLLSKGKSLKNSIEETLNLDLNTIVLMGADVLDGSYNPTFSGHLIMLADLLSRQGANCFISGFSVSKKFHPTIQGIFERINKDIVVNLRDPLSFERFTSNVSRPAKLTADIAFLMEPVPGSILKTISPWLDRCRQKGRAVIGVNCHPLLLELTDRSRVQIFIDAFTQLLVKLHSDEAVSFIMIDHDQRGDSSDHLCLKPIYQNLQAQLRDDILYPAERMKAPEIKAFVKELDGIISGRMHLMIAAMGVGTPVFGIDYKDKMEGLLRLNNLPVDYLTNSSNIMHNFEKELARIRDFIHDLPSLKRQLDANHESIIKRAQNNFSLEAESAS